MLPKSFFIVDYEDRAVNNIFQHIYGMERKVHLDDADVVIFTGGEDVDPDLYKERCLRGTRFSKRRDAVELEAFYNAHQQEKQMVGICRGAQFIHVMQGNKLWQDVDGHGLGGATHGAVDLVSGDYVKVTSCHHQMMRVENVHNQDNKFKIVALAARSTFRSSDSSTLRVSKKGNVLKNDIEVLWYPDIRAICYQGHPEYRDPNCFSYFTSLMKRYEFISKEFNLEIPSRRARSIAIGDE